MNQRGEMNLVFVLLVAGLSSLLILCAMNLHRSFRLLEKRTELFLCVKETEGEMVRYMKFMGRTNWALKNIRRAQAIMVFIPGLQGVALDAEKLRDAIILVQDASLIPYMKKLSELKLRGCPLDPRLLKTPFQLGPRGYLRGFSKQAKLRNGKWTYHYISLPYSISVEWNAAAYEAVRPLLIRNSSEKTAKLSSIFASY